MDLIINPRLNKKELLQLTSVAGQLQLASDVTSFQRGLRKSYVVAAYEDRKLLGLVRAISDNATMACVVDLVVAPSASKDLPSRLVHHIMTHFERLETVVLMPTQALDEHPTGFAPLTKALVKRR